LPIVDSQMHCKLCYRDLSGYGVVRRRYFLSSVLQDLATTENLRNPEFSRGQQVENLLNSAINLLIGVSTLLAG
jgi:hypothetical protein